MVHHESKTLALPDQRVLLPGGDSSLDVPQQCSSISQLFFSTDRGIQKSGITGNAGEYGQSNSNSLRGAMSENHTWNARRVSRI